MRRTRKPNDGEPREPSPDETKKPFLKRLFGEDEPDQEPARPEYRFFSRRPPEMPDEERQQEQLQEERRQQEAAARLLSQIASARERVVQLEASLQQTEQDLLRYHTICRRCTQPLQMIFGFSDRAADEKAGAMDPAQEFQPLFISPLVASLKNSGVLVDSSPSGVRLTLPAVSPETQALAGEPQNEYDLQSKYIPHPQQSQLDELLEREQALLQRIDHLRRIYEPYRQICLACREPLEALLCFSLWSMPEQPDAAQARQGLRRAADALEAALSTVGITLRRYEDIADNPEERGKFSIVEHGYVYPAVLWRGDFFFEAVGQTTVDRAQGVRQL